MISLILVFLIILWLTGYLQVPLFALPLFTLGAKVVTLNDLLLLMVIVWLVDLLPYPFRQIIFVLLLLWILASVGIIAVAGFSHIVLIAMIIGLIVYITRFTHVEK